VELKETGCQTSNLKRETVLERNMFVQRRCFGFPENTTNWIPLKP